MYLAGRAPYLGQWDSFDYLKQIVSHRLSDLGFGRPVYLGYNIALWEATGKAFALDPLAVGPVVQWATIALGGAGVLLFHRLASALLAPRAARMATLAFLLSPVYALYSGYVMTEVPMLAALLAAAAVVAGGRGGASPARDVAGGILFGLAAGIREQAVVCGGAYAWLLWISRPEGRERLRALARFALAASAAAAVPVAALYASDPAAFAERMRVWLRAIPTGTAQVPLNVAASLLYLLILCPAAWLAAAGAAVLRRSPAPPPEPPALPPATRSGLWGVLLGLVVPVVALWRDADVQIHPRYLLVALPAAALACAAVYHRFAPSVRAAVVWSVLQIALFGVSQLGIQRIRNLQWERRAYAERVREAVPGDALIVAGGYSPIFDYYRVVGGRAGWTIVWSGWSWDKRAVGGAITRATARGVPVYVCDGPAAWLNFEAERLELHGLLAGRGKENVFPGLMRVSPPFRID